MILSIGLHDHALTGAGGQGDVLLAVDDVPVEDKSLKSVGDLIVGPVPPNPIACKSLQA